MTQVWGKHHLDWMYRGLVRSLTWPQNKAALDGAKWTIFGDLADTQRVFEIATKALPFTEIELKQKVERTPGQVEMVDHLLQMMKMCLLEKAPMLMAPPDTIFADGTIGVLRIYGEQSGTVVSVAHPRATPEIMNDLGIDPPSNESLVGLVRRHDHKSFSRSNRNLEVGGSKTGGVSWQEPEAGICLVQHRLPTAYFVNFTDDDRKWWSSPYKGQKQTFGHWDWIWPGICVIPHQRQRHIGCSDAAFVVEVTQSWSNAPNEALISPSEPDFFAKDEYHYKMNRQYVSVYRGEK